MTERLPLNNWRRVWYYLPLAYVSGLTIVMYAIPSYPFAIAFTIIALLIARKLRRDRMFHSIRTNRSADENYVLAMSLIDGTDWCINKSVHGELIEALTYPPFWKGSWGELVTLRFESDRVLINSICDPHRHPSVASWGQNRKNVSFLLKALAVDTVQPFHRP